MAWQHRARQKLHKTGAVLSFPDRLSDWIAARRNDFLPASLTAAVVAISAAVAWVGLAMVDAKAVLGNVLASLILVGPALVLSNIVVARLTALIESPRVCSPKIPT